MKTLGAFCFVLIAVSAQSVQTAPQVPPEIQLPEPAPTIRERVEVVMVPVVVRDRAGKAVGNLTQKDFQLFDKGKPQTISHFSVERSSSGTANTSPAPADGHAVNPGDSGVIPTRFVAYLLDDVHMPPGEFTMAREAAREHVRTKLQPGDRAGVFTTSGKITLDFTNDLALIDQALLRILPQMSAVPNRDCPEIGYYMADAILNQNNSDAFEMAIDDYLKCNLAAIRASAPLTVRGVATRALNRGEMDSQVTLATLISVIRRLSVVRGERLLVLVSSGFFLTADLRQQESDVMDRAIRSHVTISSVDARGLYVVTPTGDPTGATRPDVRTAGLRAAFESQRALAEGDSIGEIAQATGGTWFHNSNDLLAGLNRVAGAPEVSYILGFSPQDLKLDGTFHSLKVVVKERNVTTQARRGYFATKGGLDREERAKVDIHQAFMSRDEIVEIPVEVSTSVLSSDPGKAQLSVRAHIELKNLPFRRNEGRYLDTLTVVAGLFGEDGRLAVNGVAKTINLAFKDETLAAGKANSMETKLAFGAPPGKYILRLVVRDSEGEMIGARNSAVEIE